MQKTIYRSIASSPTRRSPRPRRSASTRPNGGFEALLAKLGFASRQLKAMRKRG